MSTTYPRACARCGQDKPPWFKYCPKCYAIVQIEQLRPNICDEQDCNVVIDDDHYLCRTHWQQWKDGRISECPECGEYKPASFLLCRRCNAQSANPPARRQQPGRPHQAPTAPAASNTRRAYDHHDGEEDAKAKDKRYWFNRQDNGVCNYCGHRYPYDQLEMEHMIPKELGGPDHRRNMQLACGACNRKKGTSTDIEFRLLNADLVPPDERTPPNRPVDPERLKSGTQGGRYREQQSARRRAANHRGARPGNPRRQGR